MAEHGAGRDPAGDVPPGGVFHSLRSIGPALFALLRTRLELFGIELAEEKARAASAAMLAACALLFGGLALLMLNVFVLAWFWSSYRYQAIVAMVALYGAGALFCIWRLRSNLASRPPMFDATMTELKSDIEALNRVRQG